jgi:26S proteasome regulatory subunit N12
VAALLNIKQEDAVSFERHVSQAKTLYVDYADILPVSPSQHLILGLNLMRLLAQNRIAEFHTELELIPRSATSHPAIAYVLRLEQYLMEGSYAKITAACDPSPAAARPDPAFSFFGAILMGAVRDEIAACSEKAYKTLSVTVAKELLSFSDDADIRTFADAREWTICSDGVISFEDDNTDVPTMDQVPSMDLIKRTLGYAKELESIV